MDSGDKITLPPWDNFIHCLHGKKYRNHDVGIYPEVQKMANYMLKSVTMLLSIFSNVMVVISTMTKIIEAITAQRQTQ